MGDRGQGLPLGGPLRRAWDSLKLTVDGLIRPDQWREVAEIARFWADIIRRCYIALPPATAGFGSVSGR